LQEQQQYDQQHSVIPTSTSNDSSFADSSARNELLAPPPAAALSQEETEERVANEEAIERLVSMGFPRSIVEQLSRKHSNNELVVLDKLLLLQEQEQAAAHKKQERKDYWRQFCQRKPSMIQTKCIIDFPYADSGPYDSHMQAPYEKDKANERFKLNLSGNDRLLERLYCFEDHGDLCQDHVVGGKRRRVILKVHTLRKWGERGNELFLRADKVTSSKVIYAYFDPQHNKFFMETGRHDSLKLLPVSEYSRERWQDLFDNNRSSEIEWQWRTKGSIPSFEDKDSAGDRYDEVRKMIRMGEDSVFPRGATAESMTEKDRSPWYRQWIECENMSSTNSMLRNNPTGSNESTIENRVYLRKTLSEAWKRPVHWAAFLVFGANTCLPRSDSGGDGELASAHETAGAGNAPQHAATTTCDQCEEVRQTTHSCKECEGSLCADCAASHGKMKAFRSHKLVAIDA